MGKSKSCIERKVGFNVHLEILWSCKMKSKGPCEKANAGVTIEEEGGGVGLIKQLDLLVDVEFDKVSMLKMKVR